MCFSNLIFFVIFLLLYTVLLCYFYTLLMPGNVHLMFYFLTLYALSTALWILALEEDAKLSGIKLLGYRNGMTVSARVFYLKIHTAVFALMEE